MKLSDKRLKRFFDLVIDGNFESLGKIGNSYVNQFTYISDLKYLPELIKNPNISCVISTKELISSIPEGLGLVISKNPTESFFELHNYLAEETNFYWKDFKSKIGKSSVIHPTAFVADRNVRIGEKCIIGPNVSIMENTIIEDEVVVRAGTVLGTEGFEFRKIGKKIMNVVHAGGVLIHDRVQIQANCCISKGIFGTFTEIGEDTKLDNLVHIAHNVKIGKRTFFPAGITVSGTVEIGDDVWIGVGSTIVNGVKIGNNSIISIGAVVTNNVPENSHVSGNFAINHKKFIKFIKSIR